VINQGKEQYYWITAGRESKMLVLIRRSGESFTIQPSKYLPADMTVDELFAKGKIEVTVLEGTVRLGVKVPWALEVSRAELQG
jgi:sRNA-binding carbon storage regulator CsrA